MTQTDTITKEEQERMRVAFYGRCHQCGAPRRSVMRLDGVPLDGPLPRELPAGSIITAGVECSAGHDLDSDLDYAYGELGERT